MKKWFTRNCEIVERKLACTSDVSQGIQEFSGKTMLMLFSDILIELYFIQPTLCQYISFQLCIPFFVEFRLGSKATHKLASLGYARIPCETTHRYKFSCFINDAKIGCPMTMCCFACVTADYRFLCFANIGFSQ